MAKVKTRYICNSCGHSEPRWIGQCHQCEAWNSFEEEIYTGVSKTSQKKSNTLSKGAKKLSEVQSTSYARIPTGINEFDRVMGGGLVSGSLTLIGGEPGIGKSTLLMEVGGKLSNLSDNSKVLYISGEESESQIADRSRRLGVKSENFLVYHETSLEKIKEVLKIEKPKFVILDSIQTTVCEGLQSAAGTVSQIREVCYEVMNYAKAYNVTCFVIGHVTKEGNIAGPKILEHMVDAVIYFEGDQLGHYRMLRVMKNRFGNTNEVGIFEMKENGLIPVENPSQYFLDNPNEDSYGRSVSCIVEGSRPLFIEVQALVVENKYGNGRRTTQGVDNNRLSMLVAVIEKYIGIPLGFNDIYANIVGGIKLKSRETDLAVIASLLSSLRKAPIEEGIVLLGEVGLTGEVRTVPLIEMRLKEMAQLNYKKVVTSKRAAREYKNKYKIEIIGINKAEELESILF